MFGLDVINKALTRRQLHLQFFIPIPVTDADSPAATGLADRNDGSGAGVLVAE